MSAPGQDESDKIHEPTPRKLQKAREKGEVAKSTDLGVAAAYAGVLLAALAAGAGSIDRIGATLSGLVGQADRFAPLIFDGSAAAPIGGLLRDLSLAMLPWFVVPAGAVLLSVIAQRAFVVAPSRLRPRLSRVSIISNAKNKFGRGGLFEFAKSFAKLALYSVCLALFLRARLPDILATIGADPGIAVSRMARLCVEFLFLALLIAAGIGAVDALWQHAEHLRKNRMSRKELTDETKESEGDPHIKQQRRQRAQEIAASQMMADVPGADVVIVNPTHYAVALTWSRLPGAAPICVAKGVDEMAGAIRRVAQENGVPIHGDPPTARALHATVGIGDEIPEAQYRAVAAAIRFAEEMRRKARGRV